MSKINNCENITLTMDLELHETNNEGLDNKIKKKNNTTN